MTNQGKLLISVVLAIVGAGVGAYILLGGNSSETPQEDLLESPEFEEQFPIDESGQEEPLALTTVNYTSSGFATASINETTGTTVLFRNQSSFSLQVSSNSSNN